MDDPLQSPTIVLCLRPLRLAESPGLLEAVESVKRLNSFSRTQEGMSKRAVDALMFIFKDLFETERELTAAENALAKAERQAHRDRWQPAHRPESESGGDVSTGSGGYPWQGEPTA